MLEKKISYSYYLDKLRWSKYQYWMSHRMQSTYTRIVKLIRCCFPHFILINMHFWFVVISAFDVFVWRNVSRFLCPPCVLYTSLRRKFHLIGRYISFAKCKDFLLYTLFDNPTFWSFEFLQLFEERENSYNSFNSSVIHNFLFTKPAGFMTNPKSKFHNEALNYRQFN